MKNKGEKYIIEPCYLIKNNVIPKEELDRVFRESETIQGELDATFLCFDEQYQEVCNNTSPDTIIIDLGCAYAPQSYYFSDYEKYIGVDLSFGNDVRFQTDNSEFYIMSIQEFITNELPKLNLDLNNVVAICNYVPDKEAQQMVIDTFPRHYVYYPNMIKDIDFETELEMER